MGDIITRRTSSFVDRQGGSLYELIDHVLVAEECTYINDENSEALIEEIKTAIRLLNGYIKYLKSKKEK